MRGRQGDKRGLLSKGRSRRDGDYFLAAVSSRQILVDTGKVAHGRGGDAGGGGGGGGLWLDASEDQDRLATVMVGRSPSSCDG